MDITAGEELKPRTLFTGLEDVKILCVNPTVAEAAKFGIKFKDNVELVYTTVKEDTENSKIKTNAVRLDIWVVSPNLDGPVKLALFLEDKDQIASTGKTRFINNYGQNSYSDSSDALLALEAKVSGKTWFKADGIRIAKIGECELIEFVRAWLSIGMDSKATLDSFSKLCKGDVSELRLLLTKYPTRLVQLLLIVRLSDGTWYQGVYGRYFSRSGNTTTKYWEKQLSGNTNPPIFQDSYKLKEFDPLSVDADNESPTDEKEKNPWS